MSVCPSVLHLSAWNSASVVKIIKTCKKGTLHEDLRKFITSRLMILRMTIKRIFMFNTFLSPKTRAVYEKTWKCVVEPDRPQTSIQRRKDAICVPDN